MPDWQTMRALLAGVPDLPGARCKGAADLFEATTRGIDAPTRKARSVLRVDREAARAVALRMCRSCPSLDACRTWVDSMGPTGRPRGVVAGQVITASGLPAKTQPPADRYEHSR